MQEDSSLKSVVLLKQTPDTESKIKVAADGSKLETGEFKYIINPYDEFAIEEALRTKEKHGGEVVIVSFGPDSARELIIKGLAMGADRGVLVSSDGLDTADSSAIAQVLAAAVKAENADIVFCGKQAIDDDNMHGAPMVAEYLGWPHLNVVTKFELTGKTAKVEREVEGGQVEVYEVTLPAVFGAHKSLNSPRYASLPGIMKAKKKPLDKKTPGDIGVSAAQISEASKTKITGFKLPPEKPAGKIFRDEPVAAMVTKTLKALREEAKII
jgi:electron transfer flavoprotein beta subunit